MELQLSSVEETLPPATPVACSITGHSYLATRASSAG